MKDTLLMKELVMEKEMAMEEAEPFLSTCMKAKREKKKKKKMLILVPLWPNDMGFCFKEVNYIILILIPTLAHQYIFDYYLK